jgi:hypothetical protein
VGLPTHTGPFSFWAGRSGPRRTSIVGVGCCWLVPLGPHLLALARKDFDDGRIVGVREAEVKAQIPVPMIQSLQPGTSFLPDYLIPSHVLCLSNLDVLAEMLRAGEEEGSFKQTFQFQDEADRQAFADATDVFDWLNRTDRVESRNAFIRRTVFPALLSDFLQFMYEALDNSRGGRLSVAYALIRKPLQENLFLAETLAADVDGFSFYFSEDPLRLHSQNAGGVDVHAKRIGKILHALGEEDRFDAKFLAQLRYQKDAEDSFDGACNLATHLVTTHKAIRTEPFNLNFIFSGWNEKLTQWHYLYSRLPYILFYARGLWEYMYATLATTDPVYLADIDRRITASTILWAPALSHDYRHPAIERLAQKSHDRLNETCLANGCLDLKVKDLFRMRDSGAWPGESRLRVWLRKIRYRLLVLPRKLGKPLQHDD